MVRGYTRAGTVRQKTAVLPLYHYQQLLLELICFVLNCLLVLLLLQYVMCVKAVDPAQAAGAPRRAGWKLARLYLFSP